MAACFAAIPFAVLPAAGNSRVTIDSRYESNDREYVYRVTNLGDSRIVRVEIPHYTADLFQVPEGWEAETTNLRGRGGTSDSGICAARPKPPYTGLDRAAVVEFRMRVPDAAVWAGDGEAKVQFADGTEITVAGVKVPQPPSTGSNLVMPIGFAVFFIIAIGIRELRRRRQGAGPGGGSTPSR